ncbi:MAG TPA: hypothetical protein VMT30_01950 [Candidatus Saccharimonadia bacterium]|nr:hypothetical protein [Candidatus Saccharimonadia bacterium]
MAQQQVQEKRAKAPMERASGTATTPAGSPVLEWPRTKSAN